MRSDIRALALVAFATLAGACSSTPRRGETAAAAAPQLKPAPQTFAAANNANAAATAPDSDVDLSLVKAGYSVMRRHGEVLYCRNEVITGQRIGTRICLTAAQLQVEKQNVTKARDLLNQPSYRCLGLSCNN